MPPRRSNATRPCPFADIESIMDVNGIGAGIFETIRQQITVEDDT